MAWTFDLPLAIYVCDNKSLHPIFACIMGVISACFEACSELDRIR